MENEFGYSVYRFLLPFYIERYGECECDFFRAEEWKRLSINTRYLTQSVCELFEGEKDAVCKCFSLNDSARAKYSIPPRNSRIMMHSDMEACQGDFSFYNSGYKIIIFESGVGFLVMETLIPSEYSSQAEDICFCLSNIFTNEHDNWEKVNYLTFSYLHESDTIQFSIKNNMMSLVLGEENKGGIRLFPSSPRKRLFSYHSVITDDVPDNNEKKVFCLANSLHSKVEYSSELQNDKVFSAFPGQKWFISSNGLASIAAGNNEDSFVYKGFKRNVEIDYFYIFILALHERELLMIYNHLAVVDRNNSRKLIGMKKDLLKADIIYSFKTISVEASYQSFYCNLLDEFNLEALQSDIQNVLANVEDYVNDAKDRKVNALLATISVLALVSVLVDGVALADRISDSTLPFGVLQWGVVGVVVIVITIVIIILKRKK